MKRINQVKKMCEIMDLSDYYFGAIQEAIFIKRGSDNYSKMESFITKEADTNPCKESVKELREICKMIINNEN